MQQIIFFFVRNKNFLLFMFLFFISITLTIRSNSYHTNRFVSSANFFSGGLYGTKTAITNYFGLDEANKNLIEENLYLRKQLEQYKAIAASTKTDISYREPYYFTNAKVYNNTYHKSKNYLTINKGKNDNVQIDQGVITSQGLVGIITNVSSNYAAVQSILNTNSQVNAKLKKSNHFGTLNWNTQKPSLVQLTQIPKLAPLTKGDTIVTGGKSTIFPEGILIGTIYDYTLQEDDSYIINIALFNDMTNLDTVYIITNNEATEIKKLEQETSNAE